MDVLERLINTIQYNTNTVQTYGTRGSRKTTAQNQSVNLKMAN
jgi:hypothetical protein